MERIMDTYAEYLLKLAYLYVRDRQISEDIVQEVFLKYYLKYDAEHEKAILTKMTVNQCKDYLRSFAYRKIQVMEVLQGGRRQQQLLEMAEERSEIFAKVLGLPLKYREVIIFYYYEEKPVREIAQLLVISENTIKTRLRKARILLREQLRNETWEVLVHDEF